MFGELSLLAGLDKAHKILEGLFWTQTCLKLIVTCDCKKVQLNTAYESVPAIASMPISGCML